MKLTTTFNLLRAKGACISGYKTLAEHLGGVSHYGADREINILTILESNGLDDALWSLRATAEESDSVKRLIACDFAESVLGIFESKRPGDDRPRKAIEAARAYAAGTITLAEMRTARAAAAYAAAYAAAAAAAYAADAAAAAYAADAAAAAAYAADADADAADAAAAAYAARQAKKDELAEILKRHLTA